MDVSPSRRPIGRRPAAVALVVAGALLAGCAHAPAAGGPVPAAAAPAPAPDQPLAAATLPPDHALPALARDSVPRVAADQAAKASVPATVPASPRASAAVRVPVCPVAGYAAPDPKRPTVALTFDLSADHRTVRGTESVSFTPDQPITEVVFRLWPNGPEGGRRDASLTVTKATSPGAGAFRTSALGARSGTQGTSLSIPLNRTVPAGETVQADLAFTLRLPPVTWDRFGTDGRTSYWGSGHPLLAWKKGVGWDRDPASPLPGETQDSEAANTSIAVTAPEADTVVASGNGVREPAPVPAGAGRRLWRFEAVAHRDVAVVAGPLRVQTATVQAGGQPVSVVAAVAPGVPMAPSLLVGEARRALPALTGLFGPVPFRTLTVVAVPGLVASGLEYPGVALVLPQPDPASARVVVTHELAHQWFYGLVGNDQARSPWLDEAFATYAESLIDDNAAAYSQPVGDDKVGRSMASFGRDYVLYQAVVYGAGTTALHAARAAVGGAAFDAAVRCYVRTEAWKIATPADFAKQLTTLPAALAVLRKAGAV